MFSISDLAQATQQNRCRQTIVVACCFVIALILAGLPASAEDLSIEFDSPEPTWKSQLGTPGIRISIQERRRGAGRDGGAEFVRVSATRESSSIRLEHAIPAATVLDEFELSLWMKSSHAGFRLDLQVTLPETIDPETHRPVTFLVKGESYQNSNQWQQVKCRTSDRILSDQLRILRHGRQFAINSKHMFVDRVVLSGHLPPGSSDLFFDRLELTSLVRYQAQDATDSTDQIQQTGHTSVSGNSSTPPLNVEFLSHRLYVNKKTMFPKIIRDNGEKPRVFAEAGCNVVWVKDYENALAINAVRGQGLMATATPPYARGVDGEPLDSDDANLLPFESNTAGVAFWMLPPRMSSDSKPNAVSWSHQVRNADRRFNKRPIAVDVIEDERRTSREVDLLGISRHVINSSSSIADYRDWMIQRRDQAWPDTFCWTWIQTEPAPLYMELARHTDAPPMLEPEQIRLQVYAAWAAGCRGLGYWTTTPLDHDSPAARERMLAITQLNLEADLFEHWLTAGSTPELVQFKVDISKSELRNQGDRSVKPGLPTSGNLGRQQPKSPQRELQAAMFRTERGALLLPMWLDDHSQFVPGPMAARNVSIIVPCGGETATFWEISTTGQLRYLERETTAGGVQIKLPRFDQTTAILITSNFSAVEELNQKISSLQEQSARVSVELAKLKYDRVRQVDQILRQMGAGLTDAPFWLTDAKNHLDRADVELKKQQYAEARLSAGESLQLVRLLQKNHWDNAVRRLPNSTSRPWALSFQSLPEHWKMTRLLEQYGSLDNLNNLLPSGEFEDRDTLQNENWKAEQASSEMVESSAELRGIAKQGRFSLRLHASPVSADRIPRSIAKPLVTIVTPGVHVNAGHHVRITGWVKIPTALTGSVDGALIYDSLMGKPGAVRLKGTQDWKQFELIRPVPESQEMTLTLSLQSLGEVLIDDIQITQFELPSGALAVAPERSAIAPTRYSTLDFRRPSVPPKRK